MTRLAYLLLAGLVALALASARVVVRRRARQQESKSGCLACGSTRLALEGERQICQDCGYSGRVDGGGELTAQELYLMHQHDEPRRKW